MISSVTKWFTLFDFYSPQIFVITLVGTTSLVAAWAWWKGYKNDSVPKKPGWLYLFVYLTVACITYFLGAILRCTNGFNDFLLTWGFIPTPLEEVPMQDPVDRALYWSSVHISFPTVLGGIVFFATSGLITTAIVIIHSIDKKEEAKPESKKNDPPQEQKSTDTNPPQEQ